MGKLSIRSSIFERSFLSSSDDNRFHWLHARARGILQILTAGAVCIDVGVRQFRQSYGMQSIIVIAPKKERKTIIYN